jgi:hydroxymethylpyrimidine pyrophosphatase-like HAD family hydrolase
MVGITKPSNRVLLMDLDNTIIDRKSQQLNDNRLKPTVELAQTLGWTLALSSDTPLASLKMWSEKFGITGPIVAEKGALIQVGNDTIYAKPEVAGMFSSSFDLVVGKLKGLNMDVMLGSPVEMIFNREVFSSTAGQRVVFANNLRKSSLGLFVLKTDESGLLVPDKETTSVVAESIDDVLPKSESIQKWVNGDGGLVIVSDTSINKRTGSLLLMQRLGLQEVGMVGDSHLDYIGSDIAKHYAVGNADQNFKDKADYVSLFDLTSGVVDIINGLLRTS